MSRLIESALALASPLRPQLPWLLLAVGVLLQYASIAVLLERKHPGPAATSVVREPAEMVPSEADDLSPAALPSLVAPLPGVRVPDDAALLPGARRAYRAGVHQGVDFDCAAGTPVHAAAAGYIFLIDDEPNLPEVRREEALAYCQRVHETPDDILQALHGRHLVLWHGVTSQGLLTTWYSHLDHIAPDLEPGMWVAQGEVIGWTGASGTSRAYCRSTWGELHFEVRLDGKPLGVGLAPAEAAALYRRILSEGARP